MCEQLNQRVIGLLEPLFKEIENKGLPYYIKQQSIFSGTSDDEKASSIEEEFETFRANLSLLIGRSKACLKILKQGEIKGDQPDDPSQGASCAVM